MSKIVEALRDCAAHLAGATSAYERFAGKLGRRSVQDALFSTRLRDFEAALERARAALAEHAAQPAPAAKEQPK